MTGGMRLCRNAAAMNTRSQSSLSLPSGPLAASSGLFTKLRARSSKSNAGTHKRLAQGEPSISPSGSSDENMAGDGPPDMQFLLSEVKSLREMAGRVTVLEGTVTGLQAEVATLGEQMSNLKADNTALRAQIARQPAKAEDMSAKYHAIERRLEASEQSSRAPNAMLFRIPEIAGASPMDAVNSLLAEMPNTSTGSLLPPIAASRIGVLRTERGAKPRPIKLVFPTVDAKHSFLKRGKDIRAKGFGVDIDLTPQQREERTLMNPVFNNLKAQGATPFFKGSKLFFIQHGRPVEAPRPQAPTPPPPPPRASPPPAPAAAEAAA